VILTLEVAAPQDAQLGAASRKTFRAAGGIIGRDKNSDWVLPHTKVSGRHARISCVNGVFHIEDTSRNGVFLNSTRNRLMPGRPQALKSGDRILIDPYEIAVSVVSESHDGVPASLPRRSPLPLPDENFSVDNAFAGDAPPGGRFPPPPQTPLPGIDPVAEALPGEELDPLKLIDPYPKKPPRKAPTARDLDRSSPLAAHYRPPDVIAPPAPAPPPPPSAHQIPEDYNPLAPDPPLLPAFSTPPMPPPTPRPAPPPPLPPAPVEWAAEEKTIRPQPAQPPVFAPSRSDEGSRGLAAMLAGAGFEGVDVTEELAESFGRILRVVVSGVMDVLRARHQIKDEFRMRVTHFRPADNNPLKFSANVDHALHNLLVKRNDAFLGPVEAFEDAFDDLRNHQLAVLAGMRVAFESMLAEFDPDRLQEQFDRQTKKGALLGRPARLRYWDQYRDRYEEMGKDPEVSFRKLFGEAFAKAYEEQLRQLKGNQP
jgi:type VI secretion system FHA domain protein